MKEARAKILERRVVSFSCDDVVLEADLCLLREPAGIVVFANASGSGRSSPRNRLVAEHLHKRGCATLLFDLLTIEEERGDMMSGRLRFDVSLLAKRLLRAVQWLDGQDETRNLQIGFFGSSTGAAAALIAAAEVPERIGAIAIQRGRPDLAPDALAWIEAPTLFLVGEHDRRVLLHNERAWDRIPASKKKLEIIPKATHLFEEPGAMETVAELASSWFATHL
ncbi:MAG: dienelactone hydrolase family protein, partial [Verrucomicrobiales bacterium]